MLQLSMDKADQQGAGASDRAWQPVQPSDQQGIGTSDQAGLHQHEQLYKLEASTTWTRCGWPTAEASVSVKSCTH